MQRVAERQAEAALERLGDEGGAAAGIEADILAISRKASFTTFRFRGLTEVVVTSRRGASRREMRWGRMDADARQSLFRPEVAEARERRVYGEIVLTQPVRTQAVVLLIFGIMAILAAWVTLGTYTRTEVARGILVTDQASAKVIAIRPGLVTELLVKEGQPVEAGQKLATINVELTGEGGGSAVGESIDALEAQRGMTQDQARLAATRAGSERTRVAASLAGLRQQRADIAPQIALQEEAAASAKDLFERVQSVAGKGFVSKVEVERRRQAWVVTRQELARLRQQSNAAAAEEARTAAELARISTDAQSQIISARSEAASITQRQAQLRGERAYTIVAPVSGQVAALQVAPGRTVEPSNAPTRAIGFVNPGQEVRLLYDHVALHGPPNRQGQLGRWHRRGSGCRGDNWYSA